MAYSAPTPDSVKSSDWNSFGKASDGAFYIPGAQRVIPPAPATLWLDAPAGGEMDPARYYVFFDDFLNPASATASAYHTYTSAGDGGTGTNAFQDAAGGVFNLVTAAADNDYHELTSVAENWLFASGKKLWFEARFRLSEATTNESTWWFGFSDTLTTGAFQANAAGPLASYDGALIYKTPETALTVNFEVSNAGTQSTLSEFATSISNTWHRAGFYHDGTGFLTPYFYNGTSWTTGTTQSLSLSGLEEMHLVAGVKAGPTAAAETLQIDYWKVVAER